MQKIFEIEEMFNITGRGVIVLPGLPIHFFDGYLLPDEVEIHFKDSRVKKCDAFFTIRRISSPATNKPIFEYNCMVKGIQKEELEIGAEIWVELKKDKKH